MSQPPRKQKSIDSFFQRTVRSRAGVLQQVQSLVQNESVGTQFACNLCPKICGNQGALTVHKTMVHPSPAVLSVQEFFSPAERLRKTNQRKPFWQQIASIGIAYVAVFNAVSGDKGNGFQQLRGAPGMKGSM